MAFIVISSTLAESSKKRERRQVKLKKLKFRREYIGLHKEEWRQDLDVEYMLLLCCHGNNDDVLQWSTSCLIMQHRPYIVEQPPTCPSKATIPTQKYASLCRSAKLQNR